LLSKHFEEEENVLIVSWQITTASQELRSLMVVALAVRKIAHHISLASAGVGVKIREIGQEAYLSQLNRSGEISMLFRQSNFVVTITAPSEAKGRRLAKYIIDSVATFHRRK
jgi:hypothetical protein